MSCNSQWFSVLYAPLSRLYDVMIPSDAAFANGELERQQVQLAQRSLIDDAVDGQALELGLVAGEVLHRRGHALRLHAADERGGELAR